jgi:negative regulator of flagellin synthesis FlgM
MKLTKLFPQIKTDSEIQVKKAKHAVKAEHFGPPKETDRVELSRSSKDVQKMSDILQRTPEVRSEKVQAIKEQIERGEYRVETREIADRMLNELLSEEMTFI